MTKFTDEELKEEFENNTFNYVNLENGEPIYLRSDQVLDYWISKFHAYKEALKQEIREMINAKEMLRKDNEWPNTIHMDIVGLKDILNSDLLK